MPTNEFYITPKAALDATADAIRAKTGSQASITFTQDGFADAISAMPSRTTYGATDCNTLAEMFYAIEHNSYSTGSVTVLSYFPANTESEFCDTGFVDTVRGIVIFDTTTILSSTNHALYEAIGFFGLPSTSGADQSASTVSSITKERNAVNGNFLRNTTYIQSRLSHGKLYITPKYASASNTYFQTGHTYRWIAWPYLN